MNKEIKLHTIATYNNKQYELQDLLNNLVNSNLKLQQRINKAIELNKQIKSFVYNEMVDRCVPGSTELYDLVNEELKILGGEKNR